ncbi:unnamed protein product [Vicia faba]|uniref:Diphthine--ammonia ligase n=1 Tax=Vicia faba TaxID=3906 RepID=A0AAV1AWY3_VICFA|nr:unnamed protein product [Vicia faba]
MKVVALVSGGKDSCYAMMKSIHYGHEIVALANLMPVDDSVDELDSYMFQTVGHQIIINYAECMGLPLFRRRIQGSSRHLELGYKTTQGDEVEDMYILLREVKRQIPSITAVCSGAIASDYQRLRVESVCSRLGLVSLAYLWKQDQSLLLNEMIANGIVAITVKVAAMGLDPAKHLGKELAMLNAYLHKLKEAYGINVCGEGGEYETLTLDCPLFSNARIVLDKYQIVMHSSDSIAPVGVLHPLAFHLENKVDTQSLKTVDKIHESCTQTVGPVFEVHDSLERLEATCCWLQDSCNAGLREDLTIVLRKIESQLEGFGFGWENVLYIHLYIDDMDKFSEANETYVKFITHEKCPFGVPSRSTVEMPLVEMDFSRAYMEVLVSNNKDKKVLHVQSISCWAPSCIGPYSQATLHEGVLLMAGQLGLDPPTMNLCSGGPGVEHEQALKNSEAIAKSFNCSISTSAIGFVIYCSKKVSSLDRLDIEKKQETILRQMKISDLQEGKKFKALEPITLYVLVPDLPKRAFVEVKPILYVEDGADAAIETITEKTRSKTSCYWGFKQENWHDSCIQKCVIPGRICAIILSITSELAAKICSDSLPADYVNDNGQHSLPKAHMEQLSKFCIYLLDKAIKDNNFAWEDIMSLRFYIPVSLQMSVELIQPMFSNALFELSEMNQRKVKSYEEPIFNIVPVIGAGRSASSMDNVVTCELLAHKS